VAERVARDPALAALPVWQFGGFVAERMMVCLMHAAFVALPLWRLRRGLVLGLLGAMALHYLGNLPIFFMNLNVMGLGREVWTAPVSLWIQFYFVASILLLVLLAAWALLAQAARSPARVRDGAVSCPDCGQLYARPTLRISLGRRRYERCPACGTWHLVMPTAGARP
jgi:hypothetical protein